MQWSNLNDPVTVDDNFSFGQVLMMFFVDSVWSLLVMWYVEAVFPGTYGIRQPPYFFVLVRICTTFCVLLAIYTVYVH